MVSHYGILTYRREGLGVTSGTICEEIAAAGEKALGGTFTSCPAKRSTPNFNSISSFNFGNSLAVRLCEDPSSNNRTT